MTPEPYRAWIEHIVRRGNIVVYPQYQKDLVTPPQDYRANTAAAFRRALEVLAEEGHVAPDLDRFAIVGHSAGGIGAAMYAAHAVEEKLPLPRAIMTVHAGQGPENGWQLIPLDDLSTIPAKTRVVVLVGTDDHFVGTRSSRKIWEGTKHVAESRFITLQSDDHGCRVFHPDTSHRSLRSHRSQMRSIGSATGGFSMNSAPLRFPIVRLIPRLRWENGAMVLP